MEQDAIKTTLTMGKNKKLTLRLFISERLRTKYVLENGLQPEGMIKMVVVGV